MLIHDYAHHPREIRATLDALRQHSNGKRIVAVFEPHRYTRFAGLWDDFVDSFVSADAICCTDVYSASETPIKGISPQAFVDTLKERGKTALHFSDVNRLSEMIKAGDILVFMGAGKAKDYAKAFMKVMAN
jgi:UDP-N-acetylmuramate--alanine ligase